MRKFFKSKIETIKYNLYISVFKSGYDKGLQEGYEKGLTEVMISNRTGTVMNKAGLFQFVDGKIIDK